jgi:hypothetical protein
MLTSTEIYRLVSITYVAIAAVSVSATAQRANFSHAENAPRKCASAAAFYLK